ncbi:response regulator [Saccharopolyspora sp. NPDC000995]
MIKVLVVDDDFMVAKIHSGYVARVDGFEVVGVVNTGAEAIRAVDELRPELVLLDIYLPDMDGLSVLRQLRASTERPSPDPDVIMITAARDLDTVRGAIRGGALHYLIKPFSYEALRDQLENFRSLHQKLSELPRDSPAAQQDIDQLFGTRSRPTAPPPKGLATETAEIVERILRETTAGGDDVSATECADAAGVSRVSARKYLEHFVTSGRAEVRLRYGGTGRPERRYRWTR